MNIQPPFLGSPTLMKIKNHCAIIAGAFLACLALMPLTGHSQQQILLQIGDSTFNTVATPSNYIYDAGTGATSSGQTGVTLSLSGSDTVSELNPSYLETLAAGTTYDFGGGQTLTLSEPAGAYAKNSGAGDDPDGLMDLYLFTNSNVNPGEPATEIDLGNLGLISNASYMLYLYGYIPGSGTGEDGAFTPVDDNADITYGSTTTVNGLLAVPFTTSASYNSSTDTLDVDWNRVGSNGDGVFNGAAIVQVVPEPGSVAAILSGACLLVIPMWNRARRRAL